MLFAVLTLLGSGSFAAIVVKLLERNKTSGETTKILSEAERTDAEATDLLTKASVRAVDMMKGQLEVAYARIAELELELAAAKEQITHLEATERTLATRVSVLEQRLGRE